MFAFAVRRRWHHGSIDRARLQLLFDQGLTLREVGEAGKCVLLCSNCHAEVEAGIVSLEGCRERLAVPHSDAG